MILQFPSMDIFPKHNDAFGFINGLPCIPHNRNAAALPLLRQDWYASFTDCSISRNIVLRDTSNFSASSPNVTLSFCRRIESMPISLSIFKNCTPFLSLYHFMLMICYDYYIISRLIGQLPGLPLIK